MALRGIAIGLGVVAALVLVLSFAPLPGYYNATVTVNSYEVGVLVGAVFGISSVSGVSTGQATVIDWGGLVAHANSFTYGVSLAWSMTVCLEGPTHVCGTKSTDQWFGSVPFIGSQVTATNSFAFAYLPAGNYTISVTLTGNGQTASSAASMTLGGGG